MLRFGNRLKQFCSDGRSILSSTVFLPETSYTYIIEARYTTSRLVHYICTADNYVSANAIEIEIVWYKL